MTKSSIVKIFNSQIRGTPVDIQDVIELLSVYLTEEYPNRNISELIKFISNKSDLIQIAYPRLVVYFTKKYNIVYITFNNKILSYYD